MALCPVEPMQKTFPLGIRTPAPISMEDACTSSTGVDPALTHLFSAGMYFSAFERAAMFPAAVQELVAGLYRAVRASPRLPTSNRPSASRQPAASPISPQ